jgi:hypothetical protein
MILRNQKRAALVCQDQRPLLLLAQKLARKFPGRRSFPAMRMRQHNRLAHLDNPLIPIEIEGLCPADVRLGHDVLLEYRETRLGARTGDRVAWEGVVRVSVGGLGGDDGGWGALTVGRIEFGGGAVVALEGWVGRGTT